MTTDIITASTATFAVGQKVTFIVVRQTGRTITFRSRNGRVHELKGDNAIIKSANGTLHAVLLADLRAVGERNALTDAVLSGFGG